MEMADTVKLMGERGMATGMKITFVILHYLNFEETKACVDSIEALPTYGADVTIVVVDNGSGNGSYERFLDLPEKPHVHFLHNERNLGFANGMNTGYRYAREELGASAIALMNNDLVVKQRDFIEQLEMVAKRGYDVIGPDIVTMKTHTHTNPQVPEPNYRKSYLKYAAIRAAYAVMPGIYERVRGASTTAGDARWDASAELSKHEHEQVQLHGACLIFANRFVREETEALDGRTFLYHEEDLLFQYCMRKQYRILYTPKLKVTHAGGVSTGTAAGNERAKKRAILRHHMHSLRYVLEAEKKYGRYYPKC